MPCPIATHAHHVRFELKLDAACIETTQLATFCNVKYFSKYMLFDSNVQVRLMCTK